MAIPCVRFGPFTFDPAAGELWKRDRRVKLQEQPRLILDLLIARRGQLVTREELRQLLWPADTFVDYEHGLNAAIKRLRDVLSDSAERPRFIDTVPRRGYVFIGATLADEVTPPPANADHVEDPPAAGDVPRQFAFLRSGLLVTGVLVGSAAALVLFLAWRSRPIDAGGPVPLPRRLTQLTFNRGLTYQPAVSPDGHVVVYASDRGGAGDLDLWSQRDDGSTVRLTKGPMDEHEVSFAPDGNRIVFRSERDGGGIYVMGAQSGGQPLKLAPGGHNPYVSPDGRFVAYWTGGPDTDACYGIAGMNRVFIVPIEGGTPRQIVPQFPAACWPVWAPDSRHVLITGQEKPDQDLTWFVAPIDGGAPINAGSRLEARYHFAHLPRQELWVGTDPRLLGVAGEPEKPVGDARRSADLAGE